MQFYALIFDAINFFVIVYAKIHTYSFLFLFQRHELFCFWIERLWRHKCFRYHLIMVINLKQIKGKSPFFFPKTILYQNLVVSF